MFLIKCFWYLKSLKQLFFILLISCFGLLVSSSVSAEYNVWYNRPVNVYGYSPFNQQYNVEVLKKWSFLTQWLITTKNIFYLSNQSYFAWIYNDVEGYVELYNYLNWNQGFLQHYFICDYFSWSADFHPYNLNCSPVPLSDWSIENIVWFLDKFTVSDNYGFYYNDNSDRYHEGYENWICFASAEVWKSLCYFNCWASSNYNCSWYWVDMKEWDWIDSLYLSADFDAIDKNFLYPSPAVSLFDDSSIWTWKSFVSGRSSWLLWSLVVSSWYTNKDMINWYECLGLQPALCYWWFPVSDIFDPSENFVDFTWYRAGQGVNLFQLFSLYSWDFSSVNQFLNTILTRYQNWQINSFKTEPKALVMFWAQMNTAWFSPVYIANYCDLLLKNNNYNTFTWSTAEDIRAQSCLKKDKTLNSLKHSGQDIWFQTTTWWIFWSWWDVDFDPDSFFSLLMNEITTKLNWPTSWGMVWLIPWYIIVFLLAFVFIRLISR